MEFVFHQASEKSPDAIPLSSITVLEHCRQRGIHSESLLSTLSLIPRERFLPSRFATQAYADSAIPLGYSRYSVSPHMVALMTDAAEISSGDRVLDIGTGCGYPAAVVSRLCKQVVSVEPVEELYDDVSDRLHDLGFANIAVVYAEPSHGFPAAAPFDAIFVREWSKDDEDLAYSLLLEQLAVNGRLIIPIRRIDEANGHALEALLRITKLADNCFSEEIVYQELSMVGPRNGFESDDDAF